MVITTLDRAGRSVRHLLDLAAELQRARDRLRRAPARYRHHDSAGRLQFHVFAALAEFIGDLISENTQEGLAAARARGRVGGRPAKLTVRQLAAARKMLADPDTTITEVAKTFEVSRSTIYRNLWPSGSAAAKPSAATRS